MTTQNFKLQKISCPSCVMHLEAMEDDLDGVQKVDVNFKKHIMQVEYNEEKIDSSGIVKAVSKMGYQASPEKIITNVEKKGSLWKKLFRS